MRRIYTRIVIDIETLQRIEARWYWYAGPVAEAKTGPWSNVGKSPMVGQLGGTATSLRDQQTQMLGQSQKQMGAGVEGVQRGADIESQFLTDPTSNPLYKALYNTEASQLSRGYQNAMAGTRARAAQSGFGAEQPGTQAAETQLQTQQGSRLAALPGQIEQQIAPQAAEGARIAMAPGEAQIGVGEATQRAGLGLGGEALGYSGQAAGLEGEYQKYAQQQGTLWDKLRKTGAEAAAGMAGGG